MANSHHIVPARGSGVGRTALQAEIREEVGAEENMMKVTAVNGVEMMSRESSLSLFIKKLWDVK